MLTVYELYIREVMTELFEQIQRNSPFNFIESFFTPKDVNTGKK